MKFIKVRRPKDWMELLINVDQISKIEVWYTLPGEIDHSRISLEEGLANPEARRCYNVFIAGESFLFLAEPDSEILSMIEDIYKNAVG